MTDVIAFTKVALPHGWLGNMAPYPVTYSGQEWRTTEALFQALRFHPDSSLREQIRSKKSPMAAKFTAKSHRALMAVIPLSQVDVDNMRLVLRLKLEQHPELVERLRATGDRLIVEDVTARKTKGNHRFWGAALENNLWVGDNMLGKLWMELREQLGSKS